MLFGVSRSLQRWGTRPFWLGEREKRLGPINVEGSAFVKFDKSRCFCGFRVLCEGLAPNKKSRSGGVLGQLIFRRGSGVTPDSGKTVLRSRLGQDEWQLPRLRAAGDKQPLPKSFMKSKIQDR
jgi:hypothetical protein